MSHCAAFQPWGWRLWLGGAWKMDRPSLDDFVSEAVAAPAPPTHALPPEPRKHWATHPVQYAKEAPSTWFTGGAPPRAARPPPGLRRRWPRCAAPSAAARSRSRHLLAPPTSPAHTAARPPPSSPTARPAGYATPQQVMDRSPPGDFRDSTPPLIGDVLAAYGPVIREVRSFLPSLHRAGAALSNLTLAPLALGSPLLTYQPSLPYQHGLPALPCV